MSDSEKCNINCMCFRCKKKKLVGLTASKASGPSCSDSDSPVARNIKRKKTPRVLSDGLVNSETDDLELALDLAKRKKFKHTPRIMSDEEGSSESEPMLTRRKKNVRVVSESEDQSSSDEYESSGIDDNGEEENNVENTLEVRESDDGSSGSWEDGEDSSGSSGWESDWTSVEEDCDESARADSAVKVPAKATGASINTNTDSDSSDGQSEKCPICLRNFASQEVGTPESCDHSFCAVCLQEWAKNMNTCPVDRQAFTLILVRSCLEGKIIRRIPVEPREHREDDEEIHEDPTPCEICGRCDREDRLLLCDQCDSGYHLECLDPPLETVPVEEWFCPECVVANSTQIAHEAPIGEGELFDLIDDAQAVFGVSPLRRRFNRLLPRTRQSERVRSTIIRQEIERQAEAGNNVPSTSSGVDSLDSASRLSMFFGSRHPAKVKKKVVRKKRKRTTKKVRKRKSTTGSSSRSKTTTKTKRSISKKSTTKRKVKKSTRKTKRRTKKKVDNFYSDSSNDESCRFIGYSFKSQSFKNNRDDPHNNACCSKSLNTPSSQHKTKRKTFYSDTDSDGDNLYSSRSVKRHCVTTDIGLNVRNRRPIVISDSSNSENNRKGKSVSCSLSLSKKTETLRHHITYSSDNSSNTSQSLKLKRFSKKKSKSKPIVISDTSDWVSDNVTSHPSHSLKSRTHSKKRSKSKPIVISDSSDYCSVFQ